MQRILEKVGLLRSSYSAILAGAAVLCLGAGAASASTTFIASQQGSSIFDGNGHANVTLQDAALRDGSEGGSAGAFALKGNINNTGIVENFTAFCLDIFDSMSGSSWSYSVTNDPFTDKNGQSPKAAQDLTTPQQNDILKLYNTGYDPNKLSDNAYSAGFQIALWEIVNEMSGSYNVNSGSNSGSFWVTGNDAATNEANALLAGLSTTNVPNKYKLVFLQNEGWSQYCGGSGGYCDCKWLHPAQNLVTVTTVPVPATGLLLLSAIGGFGFASRRRRRG